MKRIAYYFLLLTFFSCSEKNAIDKYKASSDKLSELLNAENIDTNKINSTILQLIEYEKTLSVNPLKPNSDNKGLVSDDSLYNEILGINKEINESLNKLFNFKEYYTIGKLKLNANSKCRCNTNFLNDITSFSVPKYEKFLFPIFQSQKSVIPVFFHILVHSDGKGGINNIESTLAAQIDTLNKDFRSANIRFNLRGYKLYKGNPTKNSYDYYCLNILKPGFEKKDSFDMLLNELSFQPDKNLNVYIAYSGDNGDNLGVASFPWDSANTKLDFVFIGNKTLPNQNVLYSGRTLTHEIGHYLGLLHIFEMNGKCMELYGLDSVSYACKQEKYSGCDSCFVKDTIYYNGDFIGDTPPQKNCYFGEECTDGCNGCDGSKIVTINFMGYNDDLFMNAFTKEQCMRMQGYIKEYRKHYISKSIFWD